MPRTPSLRLSKKRDRKSKPRSRRGGKLSRRRDKRLRRRWPRGMLSTKLSKKKIVAIGRNNNGKRLNSEIRKKKRGEMPSREQLMKRMQKRRRGSLPRETLSRRIERIRHVGMLNTRPSRMSKKERKMSRGPKKQNKPELMPIIEPNRPNLMKKTERERPN